MENKSLIVKKEGFFYRIANFFRKLFSKRLDKTENKNFIEKNCENTNEFDNQISKFSKLTEVQRKLILNGINFENLQELIKDFSIEEKEELKKLYIDQNLTLKSEIKAYKNKIMIIKSKI